MTTEKVESGEKASGEPKELTTEERNELLGTMTEEQLDMYQDALRKVVARGEGDTNFYKQLKDEIEAFRAK